VKALFKAIRHGDLDRVRQLLDKDPKLVAAVARQPPKKDDGQSPLQVAFKTGRFDIADLLVDRGADVNFMERDSVNNWRAPVIHDAIRAAVFSSRFPGAGGELISTKERFERALTSLSKIIDAGADVHASDSYGNNCLMRAAADANQLEIADRNADLLEDLARVFQTLVNAGADFAEKTSTRDSVLESFRTRSVARFFSIKKP